MIPRISHPAPLNESAELVAAPSCIMSFNVSDPTGAGGLSADICTIAAMGAHPLPIATGVLMRDTAEVFECHALDSEVVVDQARNVLEDMTLTAWKVGFLGSVDNVAAVAEVLSDYPDVPLVAYMPNLSFWADSDLQPYCDAFRELVLPQASLLVGSHQVLKDFLLPDWDHDRAPSARELAVAAAEHGTPFVLVTSMSLPDQFIDNVLASPQGAITGEKFERFEVNFVGAGDTLSASMAALLGAENELHSAVGEALAFLDQALDNGFRPGMGHVIPDRLFWALPSEEEEGEGDAGLSLEPSADADDLTKIPSPSNRSIH